MSIDRGVSCGAGQAFPEFAGNVLAVLAAERLGEAEVDHVNCGGLGAETDEEIVRLDVTVQVSSGVDILDS